MKCEFCGDLAEHLCEIDGIKIRMCAGCYKSYKKFCDINR